MSRPILLDTNALIWAMDGNQRLGLASRDIADQALQDNLLFVSAISFWEVAMLVRRGRLILAYSSGEWRQNMLGLGLEEISLTGEIGILAAELEGLLVDQPTVSSQPRPFLEATPCLPPTHASLRGRAI